MGTLMTTPDPNRHHPVDLNKPDTSGMSGPPDVGGYPQTSGYRPVPGYPQTPDYSQGYAVSPGYPETSGYPPLPDALYPPASGPGSAQPGGYPAPPYPAGYGQPVYGQLAYGQPYGVGYPAPRNGLGTAGLVLGIIAVVLSWTVWVGITLAILAIIFGSVGLGRAKRGEATNRGSAIAGLVLGIVAIALLVLLVIVGIGLYASSSTVFG
jgi:hypothetical protein